MVPLLPSVTIFSATERAALAFARVVVMRRCLMRLQTRLASMALRCSNWRPSLAVLLRCRIKRPLADELAVFLGRLEQLRLETHAKRQIERSQLVLDLVERFLAEIPVLEHLAFGLHGQLADCGDIRIVEAVGRANAELDF